MNRISYIESKGFTNNASWNVDTNTSLRKIIYINKCYEIEVLDKPHPPFQKKEI